jgi:hypothetical protein
MKSIPKVLLLPMLVYLASVVFYNTASAQITTTINISEYDVIFLTDFFDVKSDKLSSGAPGFSVTLDGLPINEAIYLSVKVNAQLRGGNGDAGQDPVVAGCTNDIISSTGSLLLTARDFASGGIASLSPTRCGLAQCACSENKALKKKIRDLALVTSTAPPGSYQIIINVFHSSNNAPFRGGSNTATINISYSTPDEIFVEINEPKTGSCFNFLTPTFNWTCTEPNVIVRVYEAGLNHRSPQDALTGGNPYLEQPVTGNTLTYPANAARQLQENRAYVLQIEANVSSSRGPMENLSQPVVFRITNDNLGKMLDNFLNSVSGNASTAYSALRSEPSNWIPWFQYGNITMNGSMLSENDLQILLNELATQQDVKLELSVENQ